MKRKLLIVSVVLSVLFVSCLDTEEKIVINPDETGNYNLSLDMSSMLSQLKAFASQQQEVAKALEQKDTTIYFNAVTDTSTQLTAQEKEILHDGSVHVVVNEDSNQLKIAFNVPFKSIAQLSYLKQHFPEMIAKIKATDKALSGDMASSGMPSMGQAPNPGSLISPASQAYAFSADKNSISNKLIDKSAFDAILAQDSSMQMVKQILPLMGDANYKTILTLPRPVKIFNGNNASVTDDKKTVTFTGTLSELFDKPESFDYKVEY